MYPIQGGTKTCHRSPAFSDAGLQCPQYHRAMSICSDSMARRLLSSLSPIRGTARLG